MSLEHKWPSCKLLYVSSIRLWVRIPQPIEFFFIMKTWKNHKKGKEASYRIQNQFVEEKSHATNQYAFIFFISLNLFGEKVQI